MTTNCTRRWLLRGIRLSVAFALALLTTAESTGAEPTAPSIKSTAPTFDVSNPLILLIREPRLQAELKIKDSQRREIEAALAEVDEPLWVLRDQPKNKLGDKIATLQEHFASSVAKILDATQRTRLDQIVFQAQGLVALTLPKLADKLRLTNEQKPKIAKILDESRQSAAATQKETSKTPADKEKQLQRLRDEEYRSIVAVLSDAQRRQLATLVGARYDLSKVRQLAVKAPELRGVETWINSEPLTLADQKGKVVALHFYAFGCINCIRNYPWYKDWHEKFASQGVTILGIHTPETAGERDIESVRRKAKEAGLLFPIAIDSRGENWNAWANNMWPSVYLIDKQGHVRYWWYGELNWEGAGAQELFAKRIQELLAEKE